MKPSQKHGEIIEIQYYDENYSESTSLQIQSQHWGGKLQLYMEVVALNYFNNYNIVREFNPSSVFHSCLS